MKAVTIPQEVIELKNQYRELVRYAYGLKTKSARAKNFAKARELNLKIRAELDKVMPEYCYVNTHGMMLETIGGASGIQGVVPAQYSFGRLEIYTPDFKLWVGNCDLADNCFGIEPLNSVTEITEREPKEINSAFGGKFKL